MWTALYVKELKEHRSLIMVLLGLTVCLEVIAVSSIDGLFSSSPSADSGAGVSVSSPHFLWAIMPHGIVLLLPFILIHSFSQETKGNTHFLLLSLPVSRAAIFSAKLAAVITPGVAVFALTTIGVAIVFEGLKEIASEMGFIRDSQFSGTDLGVLTGMLYSSVLAVTLGIASGICGLRLALRRLPGLATIAFSIFVLYVYFSFLGEALALPKVFGTYEVPSLVEAISYGGVIDGNGSGSEVNFMFVAYSIFTGLWATGIGMWLFEKKMEA